MLEIFRCGLLLLALLLVLFNFDHFIKRKRRISFIAEKNPASSGKRPAVEPLGDGRQCIVGDMIGSNKNNNNYSSGMAWQGARRAWLLIGIWSL